MKKKRGVEDDRDNSGLGAHVDGGSICWDKSKEKLVGKRKHMEFNFRLVLFNVVLSW